MTQNQDFIIRKQAQIINHLNLLIKQNCLLKLSLDEKNSFLSAIVDIDPKKNLLFLDYGPNDLLNKKVLETGKIQLQTDYQGIKISFQGQKFKSAKIKGHSAFAIPIPESMLWMQRRQFYRVKSPISKPSYLRLIREDEEPVNLPLYDISISGFAILIDDKELLPLFTVGNEFVSSRLILADNGEDVVNFEIENCIPLNPNKPDLTQKAGCKFTELSNTFESCIQRYMQQIEREAMQISKN